MITFDFNKLAEAVTGSLNKDRFGESRFDGVSIDTRTLVENQLFVAIAGEHVDGHGYIKDAIKKKCGGIMVSEAYTKTKDVKLPDRIPVVIVPDTHQALMQLATVYHDAVKAKYLAVTGSNGKTTTKELTYAMIKTKEKQVYRSQGNFNNLYGLPLSLFTMPARTKFAVFEMGISVPGEMARLAKILSPDLAIITNIGPTHLETLGTIENVAKEKFTLIEAMNPGASVLLNGDDRKLMAEAERHNRRYVTFGLNDNNDIKAARIGITEDGFPVVNIDGKGVTLKLFGNHQIYNMLAAYAACKTLGYEITDNDMNGLTSSLAPYRGEIETVNGMTLIADCYNANPASMSSGLSSFRRYLDSFEQAGRRSVVVVGDMLELGDEEKTYHRKIGQLLAVLDFDFIVAVGQRAKDIQRTAIQTGFNKAKTKHFDTTEQAGEFLTEYVRRGDIIYLKASRGIALEKVITLLKGTAFRNN